MNYFGTELAIEGDTIVERPTCKPDWPIYSLRNRETGTVTMQLLITASGLISRARLVETSGFRDLDRASLVGLLGCRFKPLQKDGVPTDSWFDMQYRWSLE